MQSKSTSEEQMEKDLINRLITGVSQWTYRDDIKNEEQLWLNLKQKLENNNADILKEIPLTHQEFLQVKNQLTFTNFVEAAQWLAGENGIAKVQVQREDATLGTIRLSVVWREDVAGGHSSYEIVNQIAQKKNYETDRERRFDVTLLINGLPIIQIELKNRTHSYIDAFRQIQKYLQQGKYTGIFSCLQMFVVTNGSDTRYIASAVYEKLKEQFLSVWVDMHNQPVTNYLDFTEQVLSIPQAHKMVTQYTVIDSKKKVLILLRPYQIHAIEAVRAASKRQVSGYVWHTTGSGKTLTSYKVARNLLQIPSIDKTIFLVDRVDLDQQTTSSFLSYAEHDIIDVDETDNVTDLIAKLYSNDRTVIVTTIQKLNYVIKRFEGKEDSSKYKKLHNLRLAFVVDECHRAISPLKQQELKRFFIKSLWYGFTGTPIFKENAKKEVGNLARTTEEQYGKRLHEYTVKEAIHDEAVLGFQVEYKSTITEDSLDDIVRQRKPGSDPDIMERKAKEALLCKDDFEHENHMLKVLDVIINKSRSKIGINNGSGKTYSALFTTSSIAQAQKYYTLLKNMKEGHSSIKISEKIRQALPDFPKFAITYSVTENEDGSIVNQEKMAESILDYNRMFGTSFSLETIKSYNADINERLARKQEKYQYRNEQLDFVIVVDRLLTGFDAPCLSTLFIDRSPMKPQDLIQAFSRTNRIFNKQKRYGQIVTFQTPAMFKKSVDEALKLYSNGGENYVLAPDYEKSRQKFTEAVQVLLDIASLPSDVDNLANIEEMKKFAKAYQEFDKTFTAIKVYSEFEDEQIDGADGLVPGSLFAADNLEEYQGKYKNVIEKIREYTTGTGVIENDIDIEYELESFTTDEINYQYILMLIQACLPHKGRVSQPLSENDTREIDEYLKSLSQRNSHLAEVVSNLWNEIKADASVFADQQISILLEEKIESIIEEYLSAFCLKWCVDPDALRFLVNNYRPQRKKQNGESELKNTSDYAGYKEITINPVSKLLYWKEVRQAYEQMIQESILPLKDKQ
ncbi:type I restriction endonuclease subunit R [Lacrimispora sp.]|uniref:type I restriction endonuclease subunit R n=1 Tax=Lacrimispora sp. TaxID=2719234 RepID=UPI00346167BF